MLTHPKHPIMRFAQILVVSMVLIVSNACSAPVTVLGSGKLLLITINEADAGEIKFTKTNEPVLARDLEMECEFLDGSTLKSQCHGVAYMDGPIATVTPDEYSKMLKSCVSPSATAFQKFKTKLIKIHAAAYVVEQKTSGTNSLYKATFSTKRLPVKIRILHNGIIIQQIVPTYKVIPYAAAA